MYEKIYKNAVKAAELYRSGEYEKFQTKRASRLNRQKELSEGFVKKPQQEKPSGVGAMFATPGYPDDYDFKNEEMIMSYMLALHEDTSLPKGTANVPNGKGWTGETPKAEGDWAKTRARIFKGESGGDYDALFGYSNREGGKFSHVKATEMTLDEVLAFQNPNGEYGKWVKGQVGRIATPVGAFQIVGTTLRAAKESLGLDGSEKFTPELQDRIGQWILKTQGTGAWEGY